MEPGKPRHGFYPHKELHRDGDFLGSTLICFPLEGKAVASRLLRLCVDSARLRGRSSSIEIELKSHCQVGNPALRLREEEMHFARAASWLTLEGEQKIELLQLSGDVNH